MTVRVIDTETTGVDATTDAIVEIASVDIVRGLDGEFGVANEHEFIVNPCRDIPPEASAVHHIINTDVLAVPMLGEVIEVFKNADAYVAHKCDFERSFLDGHLGERPWVCTYKCALRVWPDAPGHSNQTLRYWLGLIEPFGRKRETLPSHRALSDAIVTAAVFVELSKSAPWSDLVRWSSEPALLSKITFGNKHKGKRYDAVATEDPSYLEWIIAKSDLSAETKFSAEHWLRKSNEVKA